MRKRVARERLVASVTRTTTKNSLSVDVFHEPPEMAERLTLGMSAPCVPIQRVVSNTHSVKGGNTCKRVTSGGRPHVRVVDIRDQAKQTSCGAAHRPLNSCEENPADARVRIPQRSRVGRAASRCQSSFTTRDHSGPGHTPRSSIRGIIDATRISNGEHPLLTGAATFFENGALHGETLGDPGMPSEAHQRLSERISLASHEDFHVRLTTTQSWRPSDVALRRVP